jgi:hypothetical protein
MIELTKEEAQALLNYLGQKPWQEVNDLINMLGKAYQESNKNDDRADTSQMDGR